MIKFLFAVAVAAGAAPAANAGFLEQMKFHTELGYAQAAVEACDKLAINPKGVQAMLQALDATDQATVASGRDMTEMQKTESAALLQMLGDGACEAALDYEKKLGIDIFIEK